MKAKPAELPLAEIEALYHLAFEVPEAERTMLIEEHSTGNPALRREVLSLVRAASAANRLSRGSGAVGLERHTTDARLTGSCIGAYRLDRLLGRGGMGEVYAGHRVDSDLGQTLAIKVIDASLDSPAMRTAFFQERDTLARLQHAGIARLVDGGVTEDHSPYLVMELVGEEAAPALRLDEFCRSRGLGLRECVALLVDVCEAVAYAHRNLIVHGDLKPGNVLVTALGEVKLVDFGAARLLAANDAASRPSAFTPAYASPEQAAGAPLTVTSDVYSAGKLMGHVLVGIRSKSKELDAIITKATQAEPDARYATMAMLADDLRNWLEHRPVSIYADKGIYVVGKWLRRNRRVAGAVFGVLLTLVGCGIQSRRSARKAIAERDRAAAEAKEVEALAHRLLFDYQDQLQDIGSSTAAQHQVVTTTLDYMNELSSDPSLTSYALRMDMANAYSSMGALLGDPYNENLGRPREAETSLHKAIDTATELVKENPGNKDARLSLARAQSNLADVELGEHRAQDALPVKMEAVRNVQMLADAKDALPAVMAEAAMMEDAVGDIYGLPGNTSLGDSGKAAEWYARAIAMDELILKKSPATARSRRGLAVEQYKTANLINTTEPEKAMDGYRRALANIGMLPPKIQSDAPTMRLKFLIDAHMARTYLVENKYREALPAVTRAHDYAAQNVARDPLDDRARYDLATTDRSVGQISIACGDRSAARRAYIESLRNFDFMLRRNPEDSDVIAHRKEIAALLAELDHPKRSPVR